MILRAAIVLGCIAACGGARHEPVEVTAASPAPPPPDAPRPLDPDLHPTPRPPLLAIDWSTVALASDADADAVWKQIAPTGDDWEQRLDEVPVAAARPLAIALLHGGNFTCVPPTPPKDCTAPLLDVPDPAARAGLGDPCLRRLLALWSIAALEDEDVPKVLDALRAIAAIPPPESQLVAAAIHAVPETDQDLRLELLGIAFRAGQRELANGNVGALDEAHLIQAVHTHHIPAALEVLSVEAHRAAYLAAITDEALDGKARAQAIDELYAAEDTLTPASKKVLAKAAVSRDCTVAAAAARALDLRGDHRFVPRRPTTRSTDVIMHSLCVLASYETLQHNDEASLLPSYLPAKGLERVVVTYDALSDVDADGDGDPHTVRTTDLIPRAVAVLPEIADLIAAFRHCTGTACTSADRDYRFTFRSDGGALVLTRIELADRPPCPSH